MFGDITLHDLSESIFMDIPILNFEEKMPLAIVTSGMNPSKREEYAIEFFHPETLEAKFYIIKNFIISFSMLCIIVLLVLKTWKIFGLKIMFLVRNII